MILGDNHRVLLDRGNSGETDFVNASYIDVSQLLQYSIVNSMVELTILIDIKDCL